MRQIVLDTETTGIDHKAGHKLIEVGCIEINNRIITPVQYHQYFNPMREIDYGAFKIHGISQEFLADKPCFGDVVDDFMVFIAGAELIIHNAAFDIGFINAELATLKHEKWKNIQQHCSVLDTLSMARKMHAGQKNSLDALCKRYNVYNKHRLLHGALLDAQLLAEVYLMMTGGQTVLEFAFNHPATSQGKKELVYKPEHNNRIPIIYANEQELKLHANYLEMLRNN